MTHTHTHTHTLTHPHTHTHTHTHTHACIKVPIFISVSLSSSSATLQFTTSGSLYTLSTHYPLHPPTSLHHSPLLLTPRRAEPIEACWADRPGRGSQGAYRDRHCEGQNTLLLLLLLPLIVQDRDDREQTRRGSRETERISLKADTAARSPVGRHILYTF